MGNAKTLTARLLWPTRFAKHAIMSNLMLHSYEAVQKTALSASELERRSRTVYEVQNVPVDIDSEGLQQELREGLHWDTHPIRSLWPRRGSRTWIIGAVAEPPHKFK